jgi:hypothetical protein
MKKGLAALIYTDSHVIQPDGFLSHHGVCRNFQLLAGRLLRYLASKVVLSK